MIRNKKTLASRCSTSIAQIADHLRARGLRVTSQRVKILQAMLEAGGHMDAETLARKVKARNVSTATVYRALASLAECGVIGRAYRDGAKERYEISFNSGHHDHLLCDKCGRAIEFRDDQIERIQERVCRRHRFVPSRHRLVIQGICGSCRRGKSS